VRARCERTAVEPCRASFGGKADFGSVMPILSVWVRWGRVIGWVCKPEVTGSIPVRSTSQKPCQGGVSCWPEEARCASVGYRNGDLGYDRPES
jgi:hypothetical protein